MFRMLSRQQKFIKGTKRKEDKYMTLIDLITNITLDTVLIFMVALFILYILGTAYSSTKNVKYKSNGFVVLTSVLISGVVLSIYNGYNDVKRYIEINNIPTLVENGYELFIDGQKIDLQHITLNDYSWEIKDEEKIIILDK